MALKFFKPTWISIILFATILALPVMEGFSAFVLIFVYLKLGEFYGLAMMLGFTIFAYFIASVVSQLAIAIKNKLPKK
jgi:hypothetical protein